eukprot:m.159601 g.159601  ORF g.159601 m.159601 type:complete len:901 (-) comp31140_c0_seq1:32-2734(-)
MERSHKRKRSLSYGVEDNVKTELLPSGDSTKPTKQPKIEPPPKDRSVSTTATEDSSPSQDGLELAEDDDDELSAFSDSSSDTDEFEDDEGDGILGDHRGDQTTETDEHAGIVEPSTPSNDLATTPSHTPSAPYEAPQHIFQIESQTLTSEQEDRMWPQLFIQLKSIIANSQSLDVKEMLDSFHMSQSVSTQTRLESVYQELQKKPENTWTAYSARRILKRQVEQYLPKEKRTIMGFEEAPHKSWGEILLKQKQYEADMRIKEVKIRSVNRRSRMPGAPRVYKCHRKLCSEVFNTKEERAHHYETIHNFTISAQEHTKKVHRCPILGCRHRYALPKLISHHICSAHGSLKADVNMTQLVTNVVNKMKIEDYVTFPCPFINCCTDGVVFETSVLLDDHLRATHPEVPLAFMLSAEKRKFLKKVAQAVYEQLEREAELHLAKMSDPNMHWWTDEELDALTPGTIVWARYRNYPFWPGVIEVNYKDAGKEGIEIRKITVLFLGDDTCEKIPNFEKNLRPFKCRGYDDYINEGNNHKLSSYFKKAMEDALVRQAVVDEKERAALAASRPKSKLASKPTATVTIHPKKVSRTIDKAVLRRLARRGGVGKSKDKSFAWSGRSLRLLKVGTLVWYRYQNYPYWPGKITNVVESAVANQLPKVDVTFFGDGASETVRQMNENLLLFRDASFTRLVREGVYHKGGGPLFRRSVTEALEAERVAKGLTTMSTETPTSASASAPSTSDTPTTPTSSNLPDNRKQHSALKALAFAAPGKKNVEYDLQMSARERRTLARQIQMIEFNVMKPDPEASESNRTTPKARKTPLKGERTVDWNKFHKGRVTITTDLFSAPKENEHVNNGASESQVTITAVPRRTDHQRKQAQPCKQESPYCMVVTKRMRHKFAFEAPK